MEHTKVYPFTVSLPRYASWRKYAQALLNQLKACPTCRGAADGFPVSVLPKAHKLPNGKLLIFKGLTSATDQSLCTSNEIVEEYDMVSINPNCPRHGKYSRTAWLRMQSSKSAGSVPHTGAKIGPRQQIVSKARESKNYSRRNTLDKCAHKTDEVGRISSSNLGKTLGMVAKPSRIAVPVLRAVRRGENFEPNWHTQIAISTKNVAAKDLKYMSSILVQKQLNVLSMCNQRKDVVFERHPFITKPAQKSIEQRVRERGPSESNDNQFSARNVTVEKRVECGVPLTTLTGRKDLRAAPILGFEKDVRKCAETYASQFRRMCLLKELNTKSFDIHDEKAETTQGQERKLLERASKMDTEFEHMMSSSAGVPSQQVYDRIGDGSNTPTPIRLSKDDQLAISETFNLEELQQTFSLVERLNKIANTAKALQSELEDHPVRERTPTARVQLTQVQVVDRKHARDWLQDTAIEKAINKLPEESNGGRVRHFVQAFESIK